MSYREEVRNGELYLSFNALFNAVLPKIKTALNQELQSYLKDIKNTAPIAVILKLEYHCWEQCTQWRIEIDLDDY